MSYARCLMLCLVTSSGSATAADAPAKLMSHPPTRPLPVAVQRPETGGPGFFVDPVRGTDTQDGSRTKPWKTLAHGVAQLRAGDTLYLRGGTYYEHVSVAVSGSAGKLITIRSCPGELAILDGGLREFFESPAEAWEPCPDGVAGEYRSVKSYPTLGGTADHTNVLGNFGDSMVPLHGAKFLADLRSSNVYPSSRAADLYCGPGVHYDSGTGRIHVRLAHTRMPYLPAADNYQGETDPRKLPLVIAGRSGGAPLVLRGARHVCIQDLVVRGACGPTVEIADCEDVELDGLTVYGGSTCFVVKDCVGVRVLNTACRGLAAPWTFRGSLKYRSIESRLFSASGWLPTGAEQRDFEIAYSEFTDSVDGVFIGNVRRVHFHHNLLDNVTDDGIFLTAGTGYDGITQGGEHYIYQNLLRRCLTTFAFGVGHGRQKALATGLQTGAGAHIYRNVFDYRRPLLYHQPGSPQEKQEVASKGRFASDHGSPAWEPMNIYHNTILADDPPRYSYGTWGLNNAMGHGARRRVFNNIITQTEALPGAVMPSSASDFQADGNLHWSLAQGPAFQGDLFAKFRKSQAFIDSKRQYPPGWGARDLFADPRFVAIDADWKAGIDLRLRPDSPAVDAGVTLAAEWPDPLRDIDRGAPDIGAIPVGATPWHVGVRGRLTMFGANEGLASAPAIPRRAYDPPAPRSRAKPAAIVEGYPAHDVPLLAFALRRQGAAVDNTPRTWLEPAQYVDYRVVVLTGNLLRGKVSPSSYSEADLQQVDAYLRQGGTLLLTVSGRDVFRTPHGKKYLADIMGTTSAAKGGSPRILAPEHPWLRHLDGVAPVWLTKMQKQSEWAVSASQGERILGTPDGSALLYRQRVGQGQFIYLGWEISAAIPLLKGTTPPLEAERAFAEQMGVVLAIVAELYPTLARR